jgi:hypothetical protein
MLCCPPNRKGDAAERYIAPIRAWQSDVMPKFQGHVTWFMFDCQSINYGVRLVVNPMLRFRHIAGHGRIRLHRTARRRRPRRSQHYYPICGLSLREPSQRRIILEEVSTPPIISPIIPIHGSNLRSPSVLQSV